MIEAITEYENDWKYLNHEGYYDIGQAERMRLLTEWITLSDMPFSVRRHLIDAHNPPQIRWELEQKYTELCEYCVKQGLLRYAKSERGWYQPVKSALDKMDLMNVESVPVDIWLPFEMSDIVELYPGNVVIMAGAKSSGKTCCALNIVRENEHKFDEIHYFNSEMGAHEMRKRLELFNSTPDMWKAKFYSRYDNFDAAVQPGINTLNIIDFLEIHDEFYAVGKAIKAIHDNLKDSIAVVFLQKNPGQEVGLGGWRSAEVARLYVAMDKGRAKITDAKNWVDPGKNPNGLIRDFKIYHGSQISCQGHWYREVKE